MSEFTWIPLYKELADKLSKLPDPPQQQKAAEKCGLEFPQFRSVAILWSFLQKLGEF
jgi:hypothetical protein